MLANLVDPSLAHSLLTAAALALACALLGVVVVLRRWAFIGEGISHSGFGGAGTAWLAALLFPALDKPWLPYIGLTVFCLGTALAIGVLSRRQSIHVDAAVGIFMVASLAWGFVAQQIYLEVRRGSPALFANLLFGQFALISWEYAKAAIVICLVTVLTALAMWKEIMAYAFDPLLAETSGVRVGFIHYLLMILLGAVILIGVRFAGSVLVTALLVLPAATALMLSRRMPIVLLLSAASALVGTFGGVLVNYFWRYLPAGPCIVLLMFAGFGLSWAYKRMRSQQPQWV